MIKFFKKSIKLFWGHFGLFFANLGKNKIFWKKGLSVFNCSSYLPSFQKSEKTNVPTDRQRDNADFIGQESNYESNFKFFWIYIRTLKTSLLY